MLDEAHAVPDIDGTAACNAHGTRHGLLVVPGRNPFGPHSGIFGCQNHHEIAEGGAVVAYVAERFISGQAAGREHGVAEGGVRI